MLSSTLLSQKILKNVLHNISRKYVTVLSKEFDVSQFCTVYINCPYNINVKPIDVFHRQEKVFLNLNCTNNCSKLPNIKYKKQDDTILVNVVPDDVDRNCSLNVETSVKANLKILGVNGNINIGSFYGTFIDVKSIKGHISLSKSQCERIKLITNNGDITCKGVLQAGDITLQTKYSGKVTTDRIQGLKLKVFTENGSINVRSSYCNNSVFETHSGELNLQNIHKHARINIKDEAMVTIAGFDGELFLYVKKGLANVQLAKILKDSTIVIEDSGSLILKLSDECQQNNKIHIFTKDCVLSDSVKMNRQQNQDSCILFPHSGNIFSKLEVKCKNSHVSVDSISWPELLKASLNKKT